MFKLTFRFFIIKFSRRCAFCKYSFLVCTNELSIYYLMNILPVSTCKYFKPYISYNDFKLIIKNRVKF